MIGRRAALIFGLAGLLGVPGCTPDIPGGIFACEADADCPDGWSCHSDRLCYSGPGTTPEMGGSGGGASGDGDGSGGTAESADCTGEDCPCEGDACVTTPPEDMNPSMDDVPLGFESCTPMDSSTCEMPAGCIAALHIDPAGVCSLRCTVGQDSDCPGEARCIRALELPDEDVGHCFHLCDDDSVCGEELSCNDFDGGAKVCAPPGWTAIEPPYVAPTMP